MALPRLGDTQFTEVDTSPLGDTRSELAELERRSATARTALDDIYARRAGDYVTPEGEIDTDQGRTATYVSALGRGVAKGTGAIGKGLAGLSIGAVEAGATALGAGDYARRARELDVRKHAFFKAGEAVEDFGKSADINPKYADELGYKVAETVGAMVPTIGATAINPYLGAASIAGQLAGEGVEDVLASPGASAGDIGRTAALSALQTPLEFIPISRALGRLAPDLVGDLSKYGVKEGLKETGKKAAIGAVEEAATESLQTVISNKVASDVVGYDTDRAAFQGIQDAIEVGGATGALINALAAGFGAKVKMRAGEAQKSMLQAEQAEIDRQTELGPEQPIVRDAQGAIIPTEEDYYAGQRPPPSGGGLVPTIDPVTGRPSAPTIIPQVGTQAARPDEFIPGAPLDRFSTEEIQARDEDIMANYASYQADANALSAEYFTTKELPSPGLKNIITEERMRLTVDEQGQSKEMSDEEIVDFRSIAIPNYKALVETKWYTANQVKAEEAVRKFMNNIEAGAKPTRGMSKRQASVMEDIFTYNKYMDEVITANRDTEGVIDTEKAAEEFIAKITPEPVDPEEVADAAPMTTEEAETLLEQVISAPKYQVQPTQEELLAEEDVTKPALDPVTTIEQEQVQQEQQATVAATMPQSMSDKGVARKQKAIPRKEAELTRYERLTVKYKAYEEGIGEMSDIEVKIYHKLDRKYGAAKTTEEKLYTGNPEKDVAMKEALDIARDDHLGVDTKDDIDFMLDEMPAEYEGESIDNLNAYMKEARVMEPVFHGTYHEGFDVVDPDTGELGFHIGTNQAALERILQSASGRVTSGFAVDIDTALADARIMPLYTNIKNPFPMTDINFFGDPETLETEIMEQWDLDQELLTPYFGMSLDTIMELYTIKMETIQKRTSKAIDADDMKLYDKLESEWEQLDKDTVAQMREALKTEGYDSIRYVNANEDSGSTSYIVFNPENVKHAAQNTGRFDLTDPNMKKMIGDPNFKAGMPEVQRRVANRMIDKIRSQLETAGIKVSTVDKWKGMPAWMNGHINGMIDKGDIAGAYRIKGAVRGDEVVLMMDNITDLVEFQKVLYHEVIGHYSMETMFGNSFDNLLAKVGSNTKNHDALSKIAERYGLDITTAEGQRIASKEYIAQLAETNENPGLLKRIIAWTRHQLRKLGINFAVDENDIRAYITKAANKFRAGKLPEVEHTEQDIQFSMAENAPNRTNFIETSEMVKHLMKGNMGALSAKFQSGWQQKVNSVTNYVTGKLGGHNWTVLKKLPNTPEFKALRNILQANIYYYDKTARFMNDTMKVMTDTHKDSVLNYMTDADVGIDTVPEEYRESSQLARDTIDKLGLSLVEQGLLDRKVYNENKGEYLPRMYLYFLTGDQRAITGQGGSKRSIMSFLKKRKLGNSEADMKIREMLGEIKDPDFLLSHAISTMGRDVAIGDYLSSLKEFSAYQRSQKGGEVTNSWIYPTDWVEVDGRKMSLWFMEQEIKKLQDNVANYSANPETLAKIEEYTKALEQARTDNEQFVDLDEGLYSQLPTDAKKYGTMAGLSVRKEIYDDLVGNASTMMEDPSTMEKVLGEKGIITKFHRLWKGTKTVLNPPGHVRNFLGNFVNFDISTTSSSPQIASMVIDEMQQMLTAWKTGEVNSSKFFEIAERHGIPKSTFTAQETIEAKQEYIYKLEQELAKTKKRVGDKMAHLSMPWIMTNLIKLNESMGQAYQGSETLFKVAKIRDHIQNWEQKTGKAYDSLSQEERLLIESEAVNEANHWIFDYSMVPRSIRYLRNAPIGAPFITFSYLALPRIMEGVARHPQKFIKYVALPYALSQAVMASQDIDEEELKKWQNSLPEFAEDNMSFYILPLKDEDTGEIHSMNFGYYFPWEPWTRLAYKDVYQPLVGEGNKPYSTMQALGNLGVLSGPLPDMITVLKGGVDPFTKQSITNEFDTPSKQLLDKLGYLYNMATPPIISTQGGVRHGYDWLAGTKDPRSGEDRDNIWTSVPRLAGVNIYKTDVVQSRISRIRRLRSQVDKQKARNRKLYTEAIRKGAAPEELATMRKDNSRLVKDRQESLRSYIKRSSGKE